MRWTEDLIRGRLDGQFVTIDFENAEKEVFEPDELFMAVKLVDGLPTLRSILNVVSSVYMVGVLDILSPRRASNVCEARQAFYWLCRNQTARSYPEIGLFCNKRDHSTIMHGIKKISRDYAKHAERLEKCCKLLKSSNAKAA